jgi:hypothetical protein
MGWNSLHPTLFSGSSSRHSASSSQLTPLSTTSHGTYHATTATATTTTTTSLMAKETKFYLKHFHSETQAVEMKNHLWTLSHYPKAKLHFWKEIFVLCRRDFRYTIKILYLLLFMLHVKTLNLSSL